MPYDEAHTFFHDLTGVRMSAERRVCSTIFGTSHTST
jgi:hypothetical protein